MYYIRFTFNSISVQKTGIKKKRKEKNGTYVASKT